MFRQDTILGYTYTLPCSPSEFLDHGWVPSDEKVKPVAAHDTVEVYGGN
jgi:hypothetical protein